MDAALRRFVRERAADRCEYCRLPQIAIDLTFHVEHVIARQHGGPDDDSNLSLACDRCNLNKGPNLSAIDPVTGELVRLFHPRQDPWTVHFEVVGDLVIGTTEIGRATVQLLQMNAPRRRILRASLNDEGAG
jgi:hypothetical protein